jgi:hypothetical protein
VIDETTWTGFKFSIDENRFGEGWIAVCIVFKFVEFEEVNILFSCNIRLLTTDVSLLGSDNLTNISIDELAFSDMLRTTDS